MAAPVAGWIFLQALTLALGFTAAHNHSGETDTYHVSAGHLFVLRCPGADAHTRVTWSRGEGRNLGPLPPGVEVRDGLLWFLAVQVSHKGSYTCEIRNKTGWKVTFSLSVSSGECPDPSESESITLRLNGALACKQTEVFGLKATRDVRWMKDCRPVERPGKPISVAKNGQMTLFAATEGDAGKYTCLVDVTLNGRKYTAARSIQLDIEDDITASVLVPPEILYPKEEVRVVEVGKREEVKCLAYIGFGKDETSVHWTIGNNFTDVYKELNASDCDFVSDSGRMLCSSTLTISNVLRQFLNVPIRCCVLNPVGKTVGLVLLREADHSDLYTSVALCLAAFLTFVALAAAFLLCKVEVVLAYRKILKHFPKQQAPDGKLYDAYVSFIHDDASSADVERFALQILPEQLEKHGYSLYIRGRDECPGEALHDAISDTVRQCRRLIIVLSPDRKLSVRSEREDELLCNMAKQMCYEQTIGLHDALIQNDPKVILVELGGPVDYTHLPESLRYIKRKQGSLKWRKPSTGSHRLTRLSSNRNFWKNLRYHMPSVATERLQTVV